MTTGNYVLAEVPPSVHDVSIQLWHQVRVSHCRVNAVAGRAYYVQARVKEKVNQGQIADTMFGLVRHCGPRDQ
jgi:hypothetical protein